MYGYEYSVKGVQQLWAYGGKDVLTVTRSGRPRCAKTLLRVFGLSPFCRCSAPFGVAAGLLNAQLPVRRDEGGVGRRNALRLRRSRP